MFDRSQSNVVSAILLASVVTLTVTASGAVVLSEWQDDVGDEPVADLESNVTAVSVEIEHRGGETLDPNETDVELIGTDETLSLDDPLEPGDSIERRFDRLDDSVGVVITDEPTETVLHRNSHTIINPIERLRFAVDGWTDPIYLFEDHPANYTVAQEFELGTPHPVTERANVSVEDESVVTVDEGETTLEATDDVETVGTAEVGDQIKETDIEVREYPEGLSVKTDDVEFKDLEEDITVVLHGTLEDKDTLPEVDLSLQYETVVSDVEMSGEPEQNDDSIIADGGFWEDPDGYYHRQNWVHSNVPLTPGDTYTYTYYEASSGAELWGSLRDSIQTEANGEVDDIDEIDEADDDKDQITSSLPSGEEFELEVEYTEDGSAFRFYIDGEHEATWDNLEAHDELYFSSYEWRGSWDDETSLRLISAPGFGNTQQMEPAKSGVDESTTYSANKTLNLDENYRLSAYASQQIGGELITDTGEWEVVAPHFQQSVETRDVSLTETESTLEGELTDPHGLTDLDLSAQYETVVSDVEMSGEPEQNDDSIIADGGFWEEDPDGYYHTRNWVHSNVPLTPGDTYTYTYYEASSGADLFGSLRDSVQTEANGDVDDIDEIDEYDDDKDEISRSLPSGEEFDLEVEYTEDGSAFRFYIDGEHEATWDNLEAHDELYFSSYEWRGSWNDETSLRLISAPGFGNTQQMEPAKTGVNESTTYSANKTLDLDESYRLRAYSEQELAGELITDTGEWEVVVPE